MTAGASETLLWRAVYIGCSVRSETDGADTLLQVARIRNQSRLSLSNRTQHLDPSSRPPQTGTSAMFELESG